MKLTGDIIMSTLGLHGLSRKTGSFCEAKFAELEKMLKLQERGLLSPHQVEIATMFLGASIKTDPLDGSVYHCIIDGYHKLVQTNLCKVRA